MPPSPYLPNPNAPLPSHEISVVIQGPLRRSADQPYGIDRCLAAIRQHLPEAEVIVATWQGEAIEGLVADQILLLQDPGGFTDCSDNTINTLRQKASTEAGIRAASRPWVLKLRADIHLTGTEFLIPTEYGIDFPHTQRLFERPITLLNYYTRDPAKAPYLFHTSDLIQFGLREDLLNFWQGPFFTMEELHNAARPSLNPIGNWQGYTNQRMVAEQSLFLHCLRKHGVDAILTRPDSLSATLAQCSEQYLLGNFHLVESTQAGIALPPHLCKIRPSIATVYRPEELPAIAEHVFGHYRPRYRRIWCRKYITCIFSRYWQLVMMSMIIRRCLPSHAVLIRTLYRRCIGYSRG